MLDNANFTGCKVILYDEDHRKELGKATVRHFDKMDHTISIDRSILEESVDNHILVLIFHPYGLYEFKGTIRKSSSPLSYYIIALYKGKPLENRTAIRYTMNAPAIVSRFVIANRLMPLFNPLRVQVVNVSTHGCLIRGAECLFNIGTTFEFQMEFTQNEMTFYAKVVRIRMVDNNVSEYGCHFTEPF